MSSGQLMTPPPVEPFGFQIDEEPTHPPASSSPQGWKGSLEFGVFPYHHRIRARTMVRPFHVERPRTAKATDLAAMKSASAVVTG